MKNLLTIALCSLLSGSIVCAAPLEDLVVPEKALDRESAQRSDPKLMAVETYAAKKFKVVKINPNMFETGDDFRMSLFDGHAIHIQTMEIANEIGHITLRGQILTEYTNEPLELKGAHGKPLDPAQVNLIRESIFGIRLSLTSMDFDDATGALSPAWERPRELLMQAPTEKSSLTRNAHHAAFAQFRNPIDGSSYLLQHLPNNPGLHLLTQLDPDKATAVIDNLHSTDGEIDPTLVAKRKAHNDHLERAGIDRGNLLSDLEKAERIYRYLQQQGMKKLPRDKVPKTYDFLVEHGFDPSNIVPSGGVN